MLTCRLITKKLSCFVWFYWVKKADYSKTNLIGITCQTATFLPFCSPAFQSGMDFTTSRAALSRFGSTERCSSTLVTFPDSSTTNFTYTMPLMPSLTQMRGYSTLLLMNLSMPVDPPGKTGVFSILKNGTASVFSTGLFIGSNSVTIFPSSSELNVTPVFSMVLLSSIFISSNTSSFFGGSGFSGLGLSLSRLVMTMSGSINSSILISYKPVVRFSFLISKEHNTILRAIIKPISKKITRLFSSFAFNDFLLFITFGFKVKHYYQKTSLVL